MLRVWLRSHWLCAATGALWGGIAAAADMPPGLVRKAPAVPAAYDWSGWYFGGHLGWSGGLARNTLSDPAPVPSGDRFGAMYGGLQLGYNVVLPSRILLG